MSISSDFLKGLWDRNPILKLMIGMCPTLAVTNAALNGLVMGVSTLFVLVFSAILISSVRRIIHPRVRIPAFVVIIATFVTVADMMLAANMPAMHKILGIYIPLIVVNCLILARMEVFASKFPVHRAIADAAGMGLGFTGSLIMLGAIREVLGFGTLFGYPVLWAGYPSMLIMILPPGAFITLALIIGAIRAVGK
ncbi:MAG: electron transport complex subunit RsxE [archaeon]